MKKFEKKWQEWGYLGKYSAFIRIGLDHFLLCKIGISGLCFRKVNLPYIKKIAENFDI